jgi:hypothetical protein
MGLQPALAHRTEKPIATAIFSREAMTKLTSEIADPANPWYLRSSLEDKVG